MNWPKDAAISVLSKYEDRDLDFKYIIQAADLVEKVFPESIVNPTWSGGSDKGRSVQQQSESLKDQRFEHLIIGLVIIYDSIALCVIGHDQLTTT